MFSFVLWPIWSFSFAAEDLYFIHYDLCEMFVSEGNDFRFLALDN